MEGCVTDDRGYVAESCCIYASCGMRVRFMFILAKPVAFLGLPSVDTQARSAETLKASPPRSVLLRWSASFGDRLRATVYCPIPYGCEVSEQQLVPPAVRLD